MQTCVTLLKNTVLDFQLVNLKPMNLLIKCLADINILSNEMGDGDLSNNYHHVLFNDGANDFGNLYHNQMEMTTLEIFNLKGNLL